MSERIFVPSKPGKTSVARWVWKKSKGLTCVYKDGLSCKSAWTLPELLKAGHKEGDGLPAIEVTKCKR